MAITPQKNEVFIREVDEELRRDEMIAFGRKYGVLIVIAIVLFLAALGGSLWWRHHKQSVAGKQGEQFQSALTSLASGDVKKADPELAKLAQSSHAGYRAMAQFSQVDILLKNKDEKGAIGKLTAIANDTKLDQSFRDLALIRQTSIEYDSLNPAQVIARLKSLAVKGTPWFGSAGEMVAVAYLNQNKRSEAGSLFAAIAQDAEVPESIRQRAVQMAALLKEPVASDKQKAEK